MGIASPVPARIRSRLRAAALLTIALATAPLGAQSSRISGTVKTGSGRLVAGARVMVPALAIGTESRDDGTFTLNVPAGSWDLKALHIGHRSAIVTGIVVREREETRVSVNMEASPVTLDAVVASVSRHPESIVDAPATVTHFDPEVISKSLGNPLINLLKHAPGIDLTQVGVMSAFVNGRGFNKVFNSRWLTLEDGRVAAFPETGLPLGEHTAIPKVDLADIEVIAGPGSALYGANASGGVMSVTTRDPRLSPGLTLEASAGTRQYRDLQMRYAGTVGNWGYKISGQHQAALDWDDSVRYTTVTPGGSPLPESPRERFARTSRVGGSLRYYLGDETQVALNAGASLRDALGESTNGRYQIADYRYNNAQLVFRGPRWFAQAYQSHSNSGETYRLNVETQTKARFPSYSADSVRAISKFPVDGLIRAVELQNTEVVGDRMHTGFGFVDNARVTWGLQGRRDAIESYQKLYSDITTGRAIQVDQGAGYFQAETRAARALRFVGAVRYDVHSRFPSRWSPKLGALFDVGRDKVARLTFNGAYLSPSIFQSDLYALNAAAGVVSVGNVDGFEIRNAAGTVVGRVDALRPEKNETWEAGFKGGMGRRLFIDATLYLAQFSDFMTQGGPIANPAAASPTYAFDMKTGERIETANGTPLQVYTFLNSGTGDFLGFDAAFRFVLTEKLFLSSSTSLSDVIKTDNPATASPEAIAFNTSSHRSSLGVQYFAASSFELGARVRYVHGYDFRSGAEFGHIPTFGTLSASASWRLESIGTTLTLQADNLASCVSGTVAPPAAGVAPGAQFGYTPGRSCGVGQRHRELLNMPAIGSMVYIGARREWR